MLSKRLAGSAAICLLLAGGATACGDNKDTGNDTAAASSAAATKLDTDKLSAQDIQKQTKDALASATSVKLKGTVAADDGAMEFDLAMDTKKQCTGTVTNPAVGKVEIISDGKTSYLKPEAKFWTAIFGPEAGAKATELFKGRYLTGFDSDPKMQSLASACDLAALTKNFVEGGANSKLEKGSAGDVNGVKTFGIKATNDKGGQSVIHVATEGKPYPMRIEKTSAKSGTGKVDLTDYDKPITVQAPPADNTIDFAKFKDQIKTA
ncbi:hypothetical protein F7Q99_11675 [Streptomyces kaniharaensis]|uniref:Lipoprotein n=1 Tax=Streptomyces kaniharaensis TaxID=212423 RepID=A0A6N7KSF8_9ACTN|nr:hypothetical protein [Streptomyces kaniharaensis]MQS12934.1 hypothetical protein [Streptomyces kaniharaensis]